jgi:hypothetical protein
MQTPLRVNPFSILIFTALGGTIPVDSRSMKKAASNHTG